MYAFEFASLSKCACVSWFAKDILRTHVADNAIEFFTYKLKKQVTPTYRWECYWTLTESKLLLNSSDASFWHDVLSGKPKKITTPSISSE